MHHRILSVLGAAALGLCFATGPAAAADGAVVLQGDGIVRVRSGYGVDETVSRLKADVAAKGIRFFSAIDQAKRSSRWPRASSSRSPRLSGNSAARDQAR